MQLPFGWNWARFAIDHHGVLHFVGEERTNDAAVYGIMHQSFDPATKTWSVVKRISKPTQNHSEVPDIQVDELNNLLVMYQVRQADKTLTHVMVTSADGGKTWGPYTT